MTEAMPFLQKTILLSYDPRPLSGVFFCPETPEIASYPDFFQKNPKKLKKGVDKPGGM